MKTIIVIISSFVLMLGGVAYAHNTGSPTIGWASIDKTGTHSFAYEGNYSVQVSHYRVKMTLCLWHENANGWHVHTATCGTGSRSNTTSIGLSNQVSIDCSGGDTDGRWRSRIKAWVEGSQGDKHGIIYDNSDNTPSHNC